MSDFSDITAASKTERIRAWAVEQAVRSGVSRNNLVERAAEIEKFVLEGKSNG